MYLYKADLFINTGLGNIIFDSKLTVASSEKEAEGNIIEDLCEEKENFSSIKVEKIEEINGYNVILIEL